MSSELYVERKDLPHELFDINLNGATDKQLLQISSEQDVNLSLPEMRELQKHSRGIKRNFSIVEIKKFGQTWSTHCSHKDFRARVETPRGRLIVDDMLKSYIMDAARKIKSPYVHLAFNDNAAIIRLGDTGYGIAFKVETHNHPTMIDPYEGAATGIGGLIRDIMGVGATPIGGMLGLFLGPLDSSKLELPESIKTPREIFGPAVEGVANYVKVLNTAVVGGVAHFDPSYTGNVGLFAGGLGIMPLDAYVKNAKPDDAAVLVGSKTGRDGIGGVIFASKELGAGTEVKEEEELGEKIPKGYPEIARGIIRGLNKARERKLYSAVTDLGGGGISCATSETAYSNNCSIDVDLSKAPLKYPMKVFDIDTSETQERMFFAVGPENVGGFVDTFAEEGVEATVIGKFLPPEPDGRKTIRNYYKGCKVAELDLDFLLHPPKLAIVEKWTQTPGLIEPKFDEPKNLGEYLKKLLAAPNISSREQIINKFDGERCKNFALRSISKYGPNDAAVIRPLEDYGDYPIGVAVSFGFVPNYGKINPYWMGAAAVDEAVRNNVAVGGRNIVLAGNFMNGDSNDPRVMAEIEMSCRGYCDAAVELYAEPTTGKDSLKNKSKIGSVTPTLLITALGQIPDASKAISSGLKRSGDSIYIIGRTYREMGGSEYYNLMGNLGSTVPVFRGSDARKTMKAVTAAIDAGYINACHDCSEGGLGVAAAEMAFSNKYGQGLEINLSKVPRQRGMSRNDFILFSESNSRFLAEVPQKYGEDFEHHIKKSGVSYSLIGRVAKDRNLNVYGAKGHSIIDESLSELRKAWKTPLI